MIDPDASSEDEKTASQMEASKMAKKIEATLSDDAIDKMSKSALSDLKAQKEKLAAAKKERELKMKEINKNFDRKDKRDTLRFLVKHGLTMEEAKRYTQLGMELKMENVREEDKKMLETNF